MIINGTALDDFLNGSSSNDVINGYAGADTIKGSGGNDILNGGDGSDDIEGGSGNDVIDGGAGNDFIREWSNGSDTIRGGDGDDWINVVHTGSYSNKELIFIEGGSGNDRVRFSSWASGTTDIYLGDGDDELSLGNVASTAYLMVTTGAGRDVIVLEEFSPVGSNLIVKDFQAGNEGDTFNIINYIGLNAIDWDGSNPFGMGGFLRLTQSKDSVAIEIDRDGAAGSTFTWTTIARFENTSTEFLTAVNFGGYDPLGAQPIGMTVTGTDVANRLVGSVGADVIVGLGGADTIDAGNGNDVIDGGAGADIIRSGYGNDVVDGGEGNDVISDGGGSDTLRGGAGNDTISITRPSPWSTEVIQIEAGTGDDVVSLSTFGLGAVFVDLGDGADRLEVGGSQGSVRIILGAGQDRLELTDFRPETGARTIADFKSGSDGDSIAFSQFVFDNVGDRKAVNPFSKGYARLVQSGNDTLVQVDTDGVGGEFDFVTAVRLEGVHAYSLNASNFDGLKPKVVKVVGPNPNETVGTNLVDELYGTAGEDVLRGLGGFDTLSGYGGRDVLDGGAGDDILIGGDGSDVFLFASKALGADTINDFGIDDLLVTTKKLTDGNRDGKIDFGSDLELDFSGGGHAFILTDTGSVLTSLEYDGSFVAGKVTYYVYSRLGSAVGVTDADALL